MFDEDFWFSVEIKLSKPVKEFLIICVNSSKSVLLIGLFSIPLPDDEKSSSTPSSSFDERRRELKLSFIHRSS